MNKHIIIIIIIYILILSLSLASTHVINNMFIYGYISSLSHSIFENIGLQSI
jgi:hypothetical protein